LYKNFLNTQVPLPMKLVNVAFFLSLLLTGFTGGMGFANAIGYLPGAEVSEAEHLLAFWQDVDQYFRTRMPIVGTTLQITLLVTIVLMYKKWRTLPFWLLVAALGATVLDFVTILTENLPTNKYIQCIPKGAPVPDDFEKYRQLALHAHYKRCVFMIAAFVLTLLSHFLYRETKPQPMLVKQ